MSHDRRRTLIIKIGALGDVLRTTPILRQLNGEIWWLTASESIPLIPKANVFKAVPIEESHHLHGLTFDTILSLDDDYEAALIASKIPCRRLVGAYLDNGSITYTPDSNAWFDMSLISRQGKEVADQQKLENKRSWQEMLFEMWGGAFRGEEYIIEPYPSIEKTFDFGIEVRAGKRWPTKVWNQYPALAVALLNDGYSVQVLEQKHTIGEYIDHISSCRHLVSGDSLAMHIALGLRIPTVALFTCTSPTEIYGYGRMEKVISSQLHVAFYKQEYVSAAVNSICLADVHKACRRIVDLPG